MRRTMFFMLLTAVLGCEPESPTSQTVVTPALESDRSLAEQVADVRGGKIDRIQLEAQPVSEGDLQSLAQLEKLEVLLLDHPDNRLSQADLTAIASAPNLMHLRIRGAEIDPAGAKQLADMKSLKILNLPQANLTDPALAELTQLDELVQLRIGGSPRLTDAGLAPLKQFKNLRRVHLIDVPLSDHGLTVFHDMPQLESLYIDGASLSNEAYDRLFKAQPQLHVHIDQQHHDRDPHAHAH